MRKTDNFKVLTMTQLGKTINTLMVQRKWVSFTAFAQKIGMIGPEEKLPKADERTLSWCEHFYSLYSNFRELFTAKTLRPTPLHDIWEDLIDFTKMPSGRDMIKQWKRGEKLEILGDENWTRIRG